MFTEEKGLITNLQDFAVHDGPGLRVLVFFKGCPLKCAWCQNPENMSRRTEIEYYPSLCLSCKRCFTACPEGAINEDSEHRIDRSKCTRCMKCTDNCLGKALKGVGTLISENELIRRLSRYKPFFDASDRGGVTLSGGEPIAQPKFVLGLLKSLRTSGIHTAIETCGYAVFETISEIARNTDLLIYDIKHMNHARHLEGTGVSNELILDNLRRLCVETDTEIAVHVPLICGYNDSVENITQTAEFVSSLKRIRHVDLLPFNDLASGQYQALGLQWVYASTKPQSAEKLAELGQIVRSYGIEEVVTGALW